MYGVLYIHAVSCKSQGKCLSSELRDCETQEKYFWLNGQGFCGTPGKMWWRDQESMRSTEDIWLNNQGSASSLRNIWLNSQGSARPRRNIWLKVKDLEEYLAE